ncbi:IdeS/Mac family cysteine endopeptidase [Streptococcus ruminantium]|nr:IdeS/Mac family cysteine endopeptidase [Streptococcus ruminantium]
MSKKISDTKYQLKLDNPKILVGGTIGVTIHKYGYQVENSNQKITIQTKRAETTSAVFVATGENTGMLTNVNATMEYRKNFGDWQKITSDSVKLENVGLADIDVRVAETQNAYASPVQRLHVKKNKDIKINSKDGKIIGVDKSMEYRRKGTQEWFDCYGNILTGLVNGEYEIRTKANADYLASETAIVNLTDSIVETSEALAKQEAKAKDMKRQAESRRQLRKEQEEKKRAKRQAEAERQITREIAKPAAPQQSVEAQKRAREFVDAKNAEKVAETRWVKGVKVDDSEFIKHVDGSSESFVTKHTTGQGWYDINKTYVKDGDLCAGVVAANMLHWWADQNKEYIEKYLLNEKNGKYTVSNKQFDFREAMKLYTGYEKDDQSKFFDIIKESFNRPVWTNKILDLYINGYGYNDGYDYPIKNIPKERHELKTSINFFRDVFGGKQLTDYEQISDHDQFSKRIKDAIDSGKVVGIALFPNREAAGHIVTVWGADFDKDGNVVAVYFSDSDDGSVYVPGNNKNRVGLKRHKIESVNGQLKITTHKTPGAGSHIMFITTLSQGEEYWKKYFEKPEVAKALEKAKANRAKSKNITTGWTKTNNKWYYLLEDGKMAKSKWIYDKNYSSWYYLDKNGEMLTNGWIKHSDNKWYYLLGDGKMAKSRWINGWYINKDGFSEKKQ